MQTLKRKTSILDYSELVAIQCESSSEYDRLVKFLIHDPAFRTIPHEYIGLTIIVPAEAVKILPLEGLSCKPVNLKVVDERLVIGETPAA